MKSEIKSEKVSLSAGQKARRINSDSDLYGSFAEIGAGQETVRHFFRVGGASRTIAKAMSAYDKDFSDAIYGQEPNKRYVCESRMLKMLSTEYGHLETRLDRESHPNKKFFAFASTIATSTFEKPHGGHGWIGVRFQTAPDRETSEVIVHIRLHTPDISLQQEAIGIIGVNLIYGALVHHDDDQEIMTTMFDNIMRHVIEVDMIQMNGPDFENVDNRLLSLQLVKRGYTDAVIFGPDGKNLQASNLLYKKNILALRGSFRPVTKVNIDMIKNGYEMFVKESRVEKSQLQILFEITLNNLKTASASGDVDEQDFLDRADILCQLGQTVLISNFQRYYKLVDYFSRYTKERMGIIMGLSNLEEVFKEKYYRHLNGGVMEAFGILFTRDLKIYVYPSKPGADEELKQTKDVELHPRMKPLVDYLTFNKRIVDIENYDPDVLHIFSRDVLQKIRSGEPWEEMVPAYVDNMIKEDFMFGYSPEQNGQVSEKESTKKA